MFRRWRTRFADYLPSLVGWAVVVALIGGPPGVFVAGILSYTAGEDRHEGEQAQRAEAEWRAMARRDGPPVFRAFIDGEFGKGDDSEELIAEHQPDILIQHRPYVTAYYLWKTERTTAFLTVVARRGQLLHAWGLVESGSGLELMPTFFGSFLDLSGAYSRSLDAASERREVELRQGLLAVAGFGATITSTGCPRYPPGPES